MSYMTASSSTSDSSLTLSCLKKLKYSHFELFYITIYRKGMKMCPRCGAYSRVVLILFLTTWMRRLFEGGAYSRAALNRIITVNKMGLVVCVDLHEVA